MMEGTPLQFGLSNNPEAIRKRNNRAALKEKRREDGFVNKYIQIKYPAIYTEAINTYKTFVDKYPGRADFTKTYYFRKWEEKNKPIVRQQSQLYVPYLPILSDLRSTTNDQVEIIEEGQQPQQQEETVDQTVQQEETVDQTAQQEETVDQTAKQEETVVQTTQQEENIQEAPQTPPQEETLQPESNNTFSGMTLDEMSIAVEEIVKALQSDSDVMDIVENFDLPDSVWNNELAIPDYVLEGDLDW